MEPILWGLEEEGIPFEIRESGDGAAREIARRNANGSPLDVGIALVDGEIVLHHHDLPEKPLFSFEMRSVHPHDLRRLGMNAARLVKRQPLVLKNGPVGDSYKQPLSASAENALEDLIGLICEEILKIK